MFFIASVAGKQSFERGSVFAAKPPFQLRAYGTKISSVDVESCHPPSADVDRPLSRQVRVGYTKISEKSIRKAYEAYTKKY
jgi:hypothetical protein